MPLTGEAKKLADRETYLRSKGDTAGAEAVRAQRRVLTMKQKDLAVWSPDREPELPHVKGEKIKLAQLPKVIKSNPYFIQMAKYRFLLGKLLEGNLNKHVLMCGGGPGIGKSYELLAACKKAGIEPVRVNSGSAPSAFFDVLSEYRDTPLIYMDDWDTLLTNKSNQAVIKSAFGPERRAVLQSVKLMNRDAKAGTEGTNASETNFPVNTKLVWLSNKNVSYFKEQQVDLAAILDRSFPATFVMSSDVDLFHYVVYMTVWHGIASKGEDGSPYSLAARTEGLLWYNENCNRSLKLSFRGIEDAVDIIAHDNAKDKARTLAAWTDQRIESERHIVGFTEAELKAELKRQHRR